MADSSFVFSRLPDDVVLKIFFKLQDDPRNWAKLACVCTKFSSLIRNICWKTKCNSTIPAVVADLLSSSDSCSSLHKLTVCCPGLLHAGVLLGPDQEYQRSTTTLSLSSSSVWDAKAETASDGCNWSLLDDLYLDTICNASESRDGSIDGCEDVADKTCIGVGRDFSACKRRKICRSQLSHLASGVWNLSREQGNKLLASRFRGDCLYICDWPGCAHMEEKRNYMLFRGIFKNFKQSRVWTTINDGNRSKIDLNCAFCGCKETWDLHSAFCLRRSFGYHDDGEPVVRAYVCENGHVSGAWTNMPLYT